MPEHSKILIVGDGAIGKTCLIQHYQGHENAWADGGEPEYEPTTFNNFLLEWEHPEKGSVQIEMWDTAGQEAFEQLRKLSYPGTDIYLVGYSTQAHQTLKNIEHKWIPELQDGLVGGEEPWCILVGTKVDIRGEGSVKLSDAQDMARTIKACAVFETSAKSGEGIEDLKKATLCLAVYKKGGGAKPGFDDQAKWAPESSVDVNAKMVGEEHVEQTKLEKQPGGGAPPTSTSAGSSPAPDGVKTKPKDDKQGGDCSCLIA